MRWAELINADDLCAALRELIRGGAAHCAETNHKHIGAKSGVVGHGAGASVERWRHSRGKRESTRLATADSPAYNYFL